MSIKKATPKSPKIVSEWDAGIALAKEKIRKLRWTIRVYKQRRDSGEPWPGNASAAIQPCTKTLEAAQKVAENGGILCKAYRRIAVSLWLCTTTLLFLCSLLGFCARVLFCCWAHGISWREPNRATLSYEQDIYRRADCFGFVRNFQLYQSTNVGIPIAHIVIPVAGQVAVNRVALPVYPKRITLGAFISGASIPLIATNGDYSLGRDVHKEGIGNITADTVLHSKEDHSHSFLTLGNWLVPSRIVLPQICKVSTKGRGDYFVERIHFPNKRHAFTAGFGYQVGKAEPIGSRRSPKEVVVPVDFANISSGLARLIEQTVGPSEYPLGTSQNHNRTGLASAGHKNGNCDNQQVRSITRSPFVEWSDPRTGAAAFYVSDVDIDISCDGKKRVHTIGDHSLR